MGIGAAVAGGTAVAGLAGAGLTSSASSKAAGQQAAAANNAAAAETNQQNFTNMELAPYNGAGWLGTTQLENLYGLNGAGAQQSSLGTYGLSGLTFQPTQAQLESTPGYQFDLNQGLQATQNANAAQGLGLSGAALKGAASYATGLANNTLTTQDQIFQNNLQNVLGGLGNLSNLGENAAAQTGQIGSTNSANIANTELAGANAEASGTVGSANALASGINSIGSAGQNFLLYNALSGGSGLFGGGGGNAISAIGDSGYDVV